MNTTKHESATLAALATLLTQFLAAAAPAESLRLESPSLRVEIDAKTGHWSLLDKAADMRWPSANAASPGVAKGLEGDFQHEASGPNKVRLVASSGAAVVFALADDGRSVVLRYEGENLGERRVLEDAVSVTDTEKGAIVVPCREGLLIPADSGAAFQQTFGASEYEGCHIRLSDEARKLFGLFGSECGREWALPHSDFFEGLMGVAGKRFHNLKPESLGAHVIPFWEMVYHDCQACYGKYEYTADQAAEYVAHHVLCARPLHYHEIPDHCYWRDKPKGPKPNGPQACFTRTDQGWGADLHPTDAFLKTTQEVLGPLHAATAHERLGRFEFVAADRSLQRAVYGEGESATAVVVNFGRQDAKVHSRFGGDVLLPPWGFAIDAPRYAAFYAKRWNGRDYPEAALFTLQAINGQGLATATRIRVFHGFGDPKLVWGDVTYEVRRQAEIGLVARAASSAPVRPAAYEQPGSRLAVTPQNGSVAKFCFGMPGSVTRTGFTKVTVEDAFSPEKGYGFRSGKELEALDRGGSKIERPKDEYTASVYGAYRTK